MRIEYQHTHHIGPVFLEKKIVFKKICEKLKVSFWKNIEEEINSDTYAHLPLGMTKEELISNGTLFFEKNLMTFVEKTYDCTIVKNTSSSCFQNQDDEDFKFLFEYLEQNGFPSKEKIRHKPIFWSGEVAKEFAHSQTHFTSTRNFMITSFMNELCAEMIAAFPEHAEKFHLLYQRISSFYAETAFDCVDVYISSNKASEFPGLQVSNFFWDSELPVLQKLFQQGIVKDIRFHFFNDQTQTWDPPVSLFSDEGKKIIVRRRNAHPMDPSHTLDLFLKKNEMPQDEYEKWTHSVPRPGVTVAFLLKIISHWKQVKTI